MRLVAHRFLPVILTAGLLYLGVFANSWANMPQEPQTTISLKSFADTSKGSGMRTSLAGPQVTFKLEPKVPVPSKVLLQLNNGTQQPADVAASGEEVTFTLPTLTEGPNNNLSFALQSASGTTSLANSLSLEYDTTPPLFRSVRYELLTDGTALIKALFDDPVGKTLTTNDFALARESALNTFTDNVPITTAPTSDGNVAIIKRAALPQGRYQLSVATSFRNDVGVAAKAQSIIFYVPSPSQSILKPIRLQHGLTRKTPQNIPLTNLRNFTFTTTGDVLPVGSVVPIVNGERLPAQAVPNTTSFAVDLKRQGLNTVTLEFIGDPGTQVAFETLSIQYDSVGPILQRAELVEGVANGSLTPRILLTFDSNDLVPSTAVPNSFTLSKQTKDGTFTDPITITSVTVDDSVVQLNVNALVAGEYQVTVKGTGASVLQDLAGNSAGSGVDQKWVVSSVAGRQNGQHVEFPPYSPPRAQTIPAEGFNPGDFVETRVARLYYYRDAHRVAQIINRNVRSYNQAAVTQSERRAEGSRDDADTATDDRRHAEREAVRAAEQARQKENELEAARAAFAEARQAQSSVATETANETELARRLAVPGLSPDAKLALENSRQETLQRKSLNQANVARFGGDNAIDALGKNVALLEQTVASYRQTELIREEAAQQAAAKEERARAKQFRDEVSAAETDPDTYVAGNINSVDPITQVSISVIGEGLIELRGPIKGINKIRTLINQIDSPVGQIKIGIFTVQVNGEKGDQMERAVGEAENHVDLSRFLVNQSLNGLRRCVQSEAAMIAEQCARDTGHYQVDRDRRYLYSFFGRDFIDELYAIDSEFLKTENTVLSLHAMDTLSLNRALFILALAKNDVRERIVSRFLESSKSELPNAEFDFRRSSELKPHVTEKKLPPWNRTHLPVANHYKKEDLILDAVQRNALQRYHFRNFSSFFDTGFVSPDTMNPMQREFIRLAQIFKARLVAEMEHKQRVLERGLIEDRSNVENLRFQLLAPIQEEAIKIEANIQRNRIASVADNAAAISVIQQTLQSISAVGTALLQRETVLQSAVTNSQMERLKSGTGLADDYPEISRSLQQNFQDILDIAMFIQDSGWATEDTRLGANAFVRELQETVSKTSELQSGKGATEHLTEVANDVALYKNGKFKSSVANLKKAVKANGSDWQRLADLFNNYRACSEEPSATIADLTSKYHQLRNALVRMGGSCLSVQIIELLDKAYNAFVEDRSAATRLAYVRKLEKETRVDLDHRKLLNHLIDEQEEKFIELVEGTRSHIAILDDYLKRLSIALEDDFKIQFYDPAFVRVRESARARAVNFGEVERTTVLTNNRDFAKVDPQATMEFDLPKRQIAIKEAFDAARALVEDSGALMNDPTFLAAFQMMGGSTQGKTVKNLLPTQSSVNEQRDMGYADPLQLQGVPGSALQGLVPEPSVFKLETGTGFQIRPVMQPDGDSVVYDFDYMYTTNISEPVRADEKHIGRVKRHFVHTAVQTGNFEIREVSRYQVALKLSRTSQGVPLLQNIPVVGAAFRPAPSAESSIQQNIIFGQTNVYPTLYDLMGLRWAQQVVDLDHSSLLEAEHVIRGRQKSMKNYVFGEASRRVDDFLDIQNKEPNLYRPDLYHPQSLTSPYHPDGFTHPSEIKDPTGNDYERMDRRPADMQEPPYDRFRHRPAMPESIQLQSYQSPTSLPPVQATGEAPATRNASPPRSRPPAVPQPARAYQNKNARPLSNQPRR